MSGINILIPSTITVFADDVTLVTLSSLNGVPDGAILIDDPSGGTFTVSLLAADSMADLTASGVAGATISQNGNSLSITGNQAQVNTALQSLEITEPTIGSDFIALTVTDPLEPTVRTALAIAALSTLGPAYVTPPTQFTIAPEALDPIGGIVLSDPIESHLAAMGLGLQGTLRVILSVQDGLLVLPGYDPAGGITAVGLGTGSIALTATANELPALNTLLAGLEYVGPAGEDELEISAQNLNGVLPVEDDSQTFTRIFLRVKGNNGAAATLVAGDQTIGLGNASLGGNLSVTGTLVLQSTTSSNATLSLTPGASLDVTQTNLTLVGTGLDFGALNAPSLDVEGALLLADGLSLTGPAVIGTAGFVNALGVVDLLSGETYDNNLALSLSAGAVFEGSGTLLLGNDGAAGMISGPGTVLAGAGDTLLIAGGSIGGGAQLQVAAGGVLVLGPVSPLYGVFDDTPLTIDSSVTLSFQNSIGAVPITGGFAPTLAGTGGAIVISGEEAFTGSITGFAPGDALIFPDLDNLTVYDVSATSFGVTGTDDDNNTVTYTVMATTPAGTTPAAAFDAGGDPEVILRPSAATLTAPQVYQATSGTLQPLIGLDLELYTSTTQSIALTLSAQHGTLSEGALSGARITISAANIAAINALLTGVAYRGTGVNDTVTITSNSGVLSGLDDFIPVQTANGGTVNAYSGLAFTEAQAAAFAVSGGLFEAAQPVAAGDAVVTGQVAFGGVMQDHGLSGTALLIDAGGDAIFDIAAQVSLGAGATIGDTAGAGSIAILTSDFIDGGNFVLGGAGGAGSRGVVTGSLSIAGSLSVGSAALTVSGAITGAAANLAATGTLLAMGNAALQLSTLADTGVLILEDTSALGLASLTVTGRATLGGAAFVRATGAVSFATGSSFSLGADATLLGASLASSGTLQLAGLLSLSGALALQGPTTLAGGTLIAGMVTDPGGTLTGYGAIAPSTFVNSGELIADAGTLLVAGSLVNNGIVYLQAGGTLDLARGASGSPVYFVGRDALLTVNEPSAFSAGVTNLIGGDAVDLVGVAPTLVSYSGGEVTISNAAGQSLSSFALDQNSSPAIELISDGAGGTDITVNGQLPCFARGTRLLTPQGYRAVETLRPGDPVITAAGAKRPVRWVGWRTLDLATGWREASPVQIEAGAFGAGLPARPVVLSPSHAVCVPGALIPVGHLVNGVTVRRLPASAVTYYHVELDRHDALLAEGLACESYYDDGNRVGLYRELGRRSPAARPMAPYVTAGSRLTALRRRLHERVLSIGYATTYAPRLEVMADGVRLTAAISADRIARIRLPAPARHLTLLSPTQAPAETDPDSRDYRALSLCLSPAPHLIFGAGFHPHHQADAGRWMGASGELGLRRAIRTLNVKVAAVAQSWVQSPGR